MGRLARKTKTRIENLLAWAMAGVVLLLVAAGVWFLAVQAGVV